MTGMSPTRLFRTVAVAEAVTWTGLLVGMFLKYVTETTELGVRVFGMLHGVVFVAFGFASLEHLLVHGLQLLKLGRVAAGFVRVQTHGEDAVGAFDVLVRRVGRQAQRQKGLAVAQFIQLRREEHLQRGQPA